MISLSTFSSKSLSTFQGWGYGCSMFVTPELSALSHHGNDHNKGYKIKMFKSKEQSNMSIKTQLFYYILKLFFFSQLPPSSIVNLIFNSFLINLCLYVDRPLQTTLHLAISNLFTTCLIMLLPCV